MKTVGDKCVYRTMFMFPTRYNPKYVVFFIFISTRTYCLFNIIQPFVIYVKDIESVDVLDIIACALFFA